MVKTTMITIRTMNSDKVKETIVISHQENILTEDSKCSDITSSESKNDVANKQTDGVPQSELNISINGTESVDTSTKVEKCEGKNSSALASKLKDDKEVESTGELGDGEPKQRRRSRLSLNSECKSKSKFKEDTNQASIVSFFQKMSPKILEDNEELHKSEEKKSESNLQLNGSFSKGDCSGTKEKRGPSKLNCKAAPKKKDPENKEMSLKSSKKKLCLKEGEGKEAVEADDDFTGTECETTDQSIGVRKSAKTLIDFVENKVSEKESFEESPSNIDIKVSEDVNLRKKDVKLSESSKKRDKDSRKLKKKTVDKEEQELASSKVTKEKTKSKLGRKSVTEADFKVKSKEAGSTTNKKTKNNMREENRKGSKSGKSKEETKRGTLIEVDDNADIAEVSKETKQNDFQHFKEVTGRDSDTKENKKVRFSEEIKEFSPKSVRKNHPVAEVDDVDEKIIIKEHQAEESSKTEIKNAFAFMMNSRHKSIGQNSPGKEAVKSDEPSEVSAHKKNKLASRKAIFQVWADTKGAKKRKLEYDEKGVVIEAKLKRRAKRLKKMLTQDQSSDNNEDKNESVTKRRSKVLQIIESDSEGVFDSDIGNRREQNATNLAEKSSKHKLKKRKRRFSSEKADKESKSLCVDSSNSDCCVSEIEGSDVNSNLKENASKSSPSAPLQQTALSSFFEIVTNRKSASVKSKLQLKSDSQSQKKKNKPKSKLALKKTTDASHAVIVDDLSESSMEIKDLLNKSAKTESPKENSAARKREIQIAVTPNTVKKWKMRLRVKLREHDDEAIEKLLYTNIVLKSTEDEDHVVKIKKKSKVLESSDSDSDEPLATKNYCKGTETVGRKLDKMQPVKLAPLFITAKPKAKVDKATIEARRKFLHSSLPESLKKVIEKQQRLEEIEYEVFPSISHVTAKPTPEQLSSCTTNFWRLPGVDLKLKILEPYDPNITLLRLGSVTNSNVPGNSKASLQVAPKITRFKGILKTIKAENPDYPVYKVFRFLHEKHLKYFTEQDGQEVAVEAEIKVKIVKRGRPKKKVKSDDDCVAVNKSQTCEQKLNRQELWTDKYKPAASEEIFGNHASVTHLKTWLTTWLEFSEEIKVQRSRRKRKNSDSSSDFESDSNADSRDSSRLPGNTLILCGPCGSGKTSAVYALCGELGVNVLELNASSKRTGKRLLLELQEATQSHQVRKKDASSLASFVKRDESSSFSQSSNSQSSDSQSSISDKKMCLILIEDVDIVFEQDESFLSALGQLLAMSKRPIVLTTTDTNCLHLRKFFLQYPVVNFVPLSSNILATWLQILCLVEGLHVERRAVAELLEQNGGDVRCTLLQLQFWVQSGGQSKLPEALSVHCPSTTVGDFDGSLCKDDSSNIAWLNEEETEQDGDLIAVHSNCLEYFRPSNDHSGLCGALPLDLGSVWWNLSGILRMPQPLENKGIKMDILKNEEPVVSSVSVDKKIEYQNLRNVVDIFETLAMADVVYEKLTVDCDLEPVHRSMSNRVKNSLDLNESMESWSTSKNISCEWSRTMLNGYVDIYNNGNLGSSSFSYSAVDEKRWRTKHSKCKDALLEAVPVLCHLDRRPVHMDYFSALRTMARSELIRASSNNKRRNRFYNYLRGVGISSSDSFLKTVCDVFRHEL